MDLSDLKPKSDTVTVELKHPISGDTITHDNGKSMTITVYGAHSKEYKKIQNQIADARLEKSYQSGDRMQNMSMTELRESAMTLACKTVKSWDITMNGKKPKLTEEAAAEIFEEFDWILDQVQVAVNNFEAFLGN